MCGTLSNLNTQMRLRALVTDRTDAECTRPHPRTRIIDAEIFVTMRAPDVAVAAFLDVLIEHDAQADKTREYVRRRRASPRFCVQCTVDEVQIRPTLVKRTHACAFNES